MSGPANYSASAGAYTAAGAYAVTDAPPATAGAEDGPVAVPPRSIASANANGDVSAYSLYSTYTPTSFDEKSKRRLANIHIYKYGHRARGSTAQGAPAQRKPRSVLTHPCLRFLPSCRLLC
jgi:hypothetical protein